MMRTRTVTHSAALAASFLGLAMFALPASAQHGPVLKIEVGGQAVIVDAAGGQTYVNCTLLGCPGIATGSAGGITWTGTIGTVTVGLTHGQSKSTLAGDPFVDMGAQASSASGGIVKISFTDTDFLVGETPTTLGVGTNTGGTQTYTAYVDNLNTQFGTGIQIGPSSGGATGPGPTFNPFSMTLVEELIIPAGVSINNDIYLATAPLPPLNLTCGISSGQIGAGYSSSLSATGGTGPYTYSILNGSLPPGLFLVGNAISGTPTADGQYSFTAQVTDSAGNGAASTVTAPCGINVKPPDMSLVCPIPTALLFARDFSALVL
jgi:hypothetical protein